MAALSEKFRVLRYDTRGHGNSEAPPGAYSLDRLGRDMVELLDALDLEQVHFCGLSLGGMMGQWLGVREPQRLLRLVIANSSAYMGPPDNWEARIRTVGEAGMGVLVDASAARWFTSEFLSTGGESIRPILEDLRATNPGGYAGCCAAIRDMDLRRISRLVSAPTLIIGGSLDPATPPSHSESLAADINDSKLVMLRAAHLSNVEQPTQFASAVLDFLSATR